MSFLVIQCALIHCLVHWTPKFPSLETIKLSTQRHFILHSYNSTIDSNLVLADELLIIHSKDADAYIEVWTGIFSLPKQIWNADFNKKEILLQIRNLPSEHDASNAENLGMSPRLDDPPDSFRNSAARTEVPNRTTTWVWLGRICGVRPAHTNHPAYWNKEKGMGSGIHCLGHSQK